MRKSSIGGVCDARSPVFVRGQHTILSRSIPSSAYRPISSGGDRGAKDRSSGDNQSRAHIV